MFIFCVKLRVHFVTKKSLGKPFFFISIYFRAIFCFDANFNENQLFTFIFIILKQIHIFILWFSWNYSNISLRIPLCYILCHWGNHRVIGVTSRKMLLWKKCKASSEVCNSNFERIFDVSNVNLKIFTIHCSFLISSVLIVAHF